ncbi:MAG: MFS transporter [Burkholderiaceae bacterium]|nr:MFS transporter [Burkholderiaceae bacterium]
MNRTVVQQRQRCRLTRGSTTAIWLIVAGFVTQFVSVGAQNYSIGAFARVPMTQELGWSRAEFICRAAWVNSRHGTGPASSAAASDRFGGRRFRVVRALVRAALFALSFIHAWWQWVVLNGVVLTVGAALIGSLVVNVTLAKWFVEKRGQAIAWSSMGVSFAGIGATPLITRCIDTFGWRVGWQAMAAATLLLTLPAALVMRRAPEDHGLSPDGKTKAQLAAGGGARAQADFDSSVTRAQAMRMPAFYMLVIAFGMFQVLIPVVLFQTIPFMTDAGYSRDTAALMIILASVPALVTKPVWGWMIDRMNPKPLGAISAILSGAALIGIVFSVQARSDLWEYAAFIVLGVGWGGMIPIQEVIWGTYFGRRHLGSVRSAALPFALILGAGGPLAVARYQDVVGSYDAAFLFVAGMSILGGVLIMALPKHDRHRAGGRTQPA